MLGGVALEHFHGHRTAFGGTQQADADLQLSLRSIATNTQRGQRAGAAFEVEGGQVVKDQSPLAQMLSGQRRFDARLASHQPVHRLVEVVLATALQPQDAEHRHDVAVRQRPSDLEQLLGRHHPLALEEPSQRLDLLGRQVGKIGQGAVLDLLSFPVALAQQERRPRGSIGDLGDIHAYKLSIPCKASYIPNTNAHYMTTQ